jgi:hypothetical protein
MMAPEGPAGSTPTSAEAMVGDTAELYLGPRTVEGTVAEATLRSDGHVELIVELDVGPGNGHVNFLDGFELRVYEAWSE